MTNNNMNERERTQENNEENKYHLDFLKNVLQLLYLRRFKQLKTLNLSGNPFCKQDGYKQYVLAFLSGLDFMDYRLIDKQSVSIYV